MLASDPSRAFYGPGHVFAAAELGALRRDVLYCCALRCLGLPCVGSKHCALAAASWAR